MKDLMTRESLKMYLQVSKPTIIRWEEEGLPVIRYGGIVRYDLDKVMAWLEGKKE